MTNAGIRCPRVVLAATLACFTALCGQAAGAAEAAPPAGFDAATERIREILREDGGGSVWGAEPPAAETASRLPETLAGAEQIVAGQAGFREIVDPWNRRLRQYSLGRTEILTRW